MKRRILEVLVFICIIAIVLSGCSNSYSNEALHINYDDNKIYGTEDYLGSTILVAGSGVSKETQLTVKELETLALSNENMQYQGNYSMLSRGGEFSKHKFTGIKLYELLNYCGLKDNLSDDTVIKFISVDGYIITMELGEISNSTYCTFTSKTDNKPKEENVPIILAFGSDGVPLTGIVGDMKLGEKVSETDGYIEKAQNDGGPVRIVFGQKSAGDFNAPDNAKWLRQIIVGEDDNALAHTNALKDEQAIHSNNKIEVNENNGLWNHSESPYDKLLDTKLKITGSAVNDKTYTLKDIEEMKISTVTDSFGASGGVNGYRGVILRDLIISNLKEGIKEPQSVTVVGADGYEAEIFIEDIMNGIDSRYQNGEHRDIIIAYAIDGNPLVVNKDNEGFTGNNGYGPMRLVVENQMTRWVKNVCEIRVN